MSAAPPRARHRGARIVPLLFLLLIPGSSLGGEEGETEDYPGLGQALKKGKLALDLRYRVEDVSDDAPAVQGKDARASTLRTALSYRSAGFRGFAAVLEFEDVTDLGLRDRHNNAGAGSLSNGVTDRPVIADPDMTEVQQAYLSYREIPGTTLAAGRQEFNLGDERFVGAVGWRQNHQSFDALRVTQGSIPRTTLTYVFMGRVNRVFGDAKKMRSHLFNAEIDMGKAGRVTPYVYRLDFDADADAVLSTSTYGASWEGKWDLDGEWSLPYRLELARQKDAGDNPSRVEAGYARAEIAAWRERFWVKLGYEVLGGSGVDGQFSTPLATLHKFNGWADKFLTTPVNGLKDLYLEMGGARGELSASLIYHDFDSESQGLDYGTEIDAQVTYKAPWEQVFAIKAALYDADDLFFDTDKLMLWTSYRF